jgi:hypothetical protein
LLAPLIAMAVKLITDRIPLARLRAEEIGEE